MAFRILGLALLLFSRSVVAGQSLQFSLEHNGKQYPNASVRFYLKVGDRIIQSGDVVEMKEGTISLFFSDFNLGDGATDPDLKVFTGARCVKVSTNLEAQDKDALLSLKTKQQIFLEMTRSGPATVTIDRIIQRVAGVERPVQAEKPVVLSFLVKNTAVTPELPVATGNNREAEKQKTAAKQEEPPAEKPQKAGDLKAFEAAMALRDERQRIDALTDFMADFPTSSKVAEAKRLLPIVLDLVRPEPNLHRYELKFALDPRVDSIHRPANLEMAGGNNWITFSEGKFYVVLRVTGSDSSVLFISDPAKAAPYRKLRLSISGNILKCALRESTPPGDTCWLQFQGGDRAPEIVQFFQGDKKLNAAFFSVDRTDTVYTFSKSWLRRQSKKSGEFTLKVLLDNGIYVPADRSIFIQPVRPVWMYVGIAVAAVLLIAFLVARFRRYARRRRIQAKLKTRDQNTIPSLWVESTDGSNGQQPASTMKIRASGTSQRASEKVMTEGELENLLASGAYQTFYLGRLWADTALAEIHASNKAVRGISDFIHGQRNQMEEEHEGTIPEIGGFLLGKYCFSEKMRRFRVLLEEFVPIVPEEHTVYQLQFSTESLVRELGDMQDAYPALALVGWFHTHPGHGLFLSKPDLMIHEGFFKESYQFAMEIDPLTPGFHTGFFTRTLAGTINNQINLMPDTSWFQWSEIEKTIELT